jgi:predicted nucleic acid-binding protein
VALVTLDSNVLIYCVDSGDPRQHAANTIVARLASAGGVLTLQALAEFFHAARRKRKMSSDDAAAQVRRWQAAFGAPVVASATCLEAALAAALSGRFQFWDAMLLATAGAAGCTALISEDMAPGARLGEVAVVRAFEGTALSPEAAAVLA